MEYIVLNNDHPTTPMCDVMKFGMPVPPCIDACPYCTCVGKAHPCRGGNIMVLPMGRSS